MPKFQDFIASYAFDKRLAWYDAVGSIAHVRMLKKCGIISSSDEKKIIKGLESIIKDAEKGKLPPAQEDIHYAVEKELIRRIGPVGGKMHTARSRNDQVALDLRLYLRDEIIRLADLLNALQQELVSAAEKNIGAVMPGYTHLQPAQPVLFSHHLLAYAWMFQRDKERFSDCYDRVNVLPLGSAALAGTSFKIDRNFTAKLLGFASVSENSMDSVSDRDFAAEFLSCASIAMMHLSRLSEELIVWSSAEFGFVRLADEFTSGSSIMPQKRNPDVAEIIRGKSGRVYGNQTALLSILKGLPLTYNRDLQEDKPPVFDTVDTLSSCLEVTAAMLASLKINPGRMLSAAQNGYMGATELADYLARKGIPFREAHGVVKNLVSYCVSSGKVFEDLNAAELKRFSPVFSSEVLKLVLPESIVRTKTSYGGTALPSVKLQIRKLKKLCFQK